MDPLEVGEEEEVDYDEEEELSLPSSSSPAESEAAADREAAASRPEAATAQQPAKERISWQQWKGPDAKPPERPARQSKPSAQPCRRGGSAVRGAARSQSPPMRRRAGPRRRAVPIECPPARPPSPHEAARWARLRSRPGSPWPAERSTSPSPPLRGGLEWRGEPGRWGSEPPPPPALQHEWRRLRQLEERLRSERLALAAWHELELRRPLGPPLDRLDDAYAREWAESGPESHWPERGPFRRPPSPGPRWHEAGPEPVMGLSRSVRARSTPLPGAGRPQRRGAALPAEDMLPPPPPDHPRPLKRKAAPHSSYDIEAGAGRRLPTRALREPARPTLRGARRPPPPPLPELPRRLPGELPPREAPWRRGPFDCAPLPGPWAHHSLRPPPPVVERGAVYGR